MNEMTPARKKLERSETHCRAALANREPSIRLTLPFTCRKARRSLICPQSKQMAEGSSGRVQTYERQCTVRSHWSR